MNKQTTVERGLDWDWHYVSSDPFVDRQPVGKIMPQWVRDIMHRATEIHHMDRLSLENYVIRLEQEVQRLRRESGTSA